MMFVIPLVCVHSLIACCVLCAVLQVDKALKGEGHSLDLTPDAPDTATDAADALAAKDTVGTSAV